MYKRDTYKKGYNSSNTLHFSFSLIQVYRRQIVFSKNLLLFFRSTSMKKVMRLDAFLFEHPSQNTMWIICQQMARLNLYINEEIYSKMCHLLKS